MRSRSTLYAVATLLICLGTACLPGQTPPMAQTQRETPPVTPDAGVATAKQAAMGLKQWLTKSAAAMDDSDFVFRPTSEVRSFGQLMAHVADKNYEFCAVASGVERPVRNIEKTRVQRAEIQQALAESFAFCDKAYAGLTSGNANASVTFNGRPMPVLSMLLFLNMHNALHYGNAITYLRLRGKVPPSTVSPITS